MLIKGSNYKINYTTNIVVDNNVCDGCVDVQNKIIEYDKNIADFKRDRVIYHELVHAFLYECGLIQYANNEILVNWIASNIVEIKNKGDKIINEIQRHIK